MASEKIRQRTLHTKHYEYVYYKIKTEQNEPHKSLGMITGSRKDKHIMLHIKEVHH